MRTTEPKKSVYRPKKNYDYLLIGSGMSALTVGSLLAKAGKTVCILEQNDIPGGYAHSFKMGDFYFCAEVHYIWGCKPGETIYEFLKKVGLEHEITFEPLDPEGYDHMVIPGHRVKIPCGYDKLVRNITQEFPADERGIRRFVHVLDNILTEIRNLPPHIGFKQALTQWYQFPYLLRYRTKTLQHLFDECRLSPEVQGILAANAGDYMLPPKDLSLFAYTALFGG